MTEPDPQHTFHEEWIVEPNYDGWRLDRYLTEKLRRATRSQVSRIIGRGIERNGEHVHKAGTRLRAGDHIRITRMERPGGLPPTEAIRILRRTPDWLFLHKPSGYLVHRTAHEVRRSVDAWLADHPDEHAAEPMHRLDRDTSGVLACARHPEALRRGRSAFASSHLHPDTPIPSDAIPPPEKTYLAIVEDPSANWTPGLSETIKIPLGPATQSRVKLRMGPGHLPCTTHAHCLSRQDHRALLQVRIEGGRQHQIRAHLSLRGTPVTGDRLYAMGDAFFLDWLDQPAHPELLARLDTPFHALHAASLCLDGLEVHAPVPAHWRKLMPLDALPEHWAPPAQPLQPSEGTP